MFSFKAQYFLRLFRKLQDGLSISMVEKKYNVRHKCNHIWHKVLTLKTSNSHKETGEINFNNIFYLT